MLYFFPCQVLVVVGLALVNGAGYSQTIRASVLGTIYTSRGLSVEPFVGFFIENSDVHATTEENYLYYLFKIRFIF